MARRVKEAEVRREELLAVATDLFIERGYERTSIERITTEAGVAKGTFYLYFDSKQDLLAQMVDAYGDELLRQLAVELAREKGDAVAMLRRFFAFSAHFEASRGEMTLEIGRALYRPENLALRVGILESAFTHTLPILTGVIQQGVDQGVFAVSDAAETASILLVLRHGGADRLARRMYELPEPGAYVEEASKAMLALQAAQERVLGLPDGSLQRQLDPGLADLMDQQQRRLAVPKE
jgi:AcrR family transcriptional regulator